MNEFSTNGVVGNDHQCLSWVELLTELDDALKVIIEDFLGVNVEFTLTKTFLVTFHHHKYNFLILIRALEEVLEVSLLLNLLLRFLNLVVHLHFFSFLIIYLALRQISLCWASWESRFLWVNLITISIGTLGPSLIIFGVSIAISAI